MNEVDNVLDSYFDVDEVTGDGLSVSDCRKLLINEMNELIKYGNLKRMRKTGGRVPLVPPFSGLKNINEAVFMARQRGGFSTLLGNCGF